jgi:hypothetical protein
VVEVVLEVVLVPEEVEVPTDDVVEPLLVLLLAVEVVLL